MSNNLEKEASPYLKMHASNPVNWYPWSQHALQLANKENKPILLSIGYTACHWCHVMAHESFEDEETAALMNSYFINIKVDREERPDIDKVYQLSAQLLSRQPGGWPLTVFLMPKNQLPFFAGTYFPKQSRGNFPAFKDVLTYIHNLYIKHEAELTQQNVAFQASLDELQSQTKLMASSIDLLPIQAAENSLIQAYDSKNGGFGGKPKFPMTTYLEFLFLQSSVSKKPTDNMVVFSLEQLCRHGLFDHLGGGFFRYTVDESWQIPHFEKMLYDNALLLSLLTQVNSQIENHPLFTQAIRQTVNWLIDDMQAPEGGYYSSISADSEGEEGKYYLWSRDEINNLLLPEEANVFNSYYGLNKSPNFKRYWHLHQCVSLEELCNEFNQPIQKIERILSIGKEKLLKQRIMRIKPQRDDKIITAWNGLTIKAMALAAFHFQDDIYLASAEKCIQFIQQNMIREDRLYSVYQAGNGCFAANLDDYTFLIEGIFYFLQARWDNSYYDLLKKLVKQALTLFEDKEAGGFFFTIKQEESLIMRLKQYADEAIPSSNAVFTKMLLWLGNLEGDETLLLSAEKSILNAFPHITQLPDAFCSFLIALIYEHYQPHLCIIRDKAEQLVNWQQTFLAEYQTYRIGFFIPDNISLSYPLIEKKALEQGIGYYCLGSTCLPPIKNQQDFANELRAN